MQASTPVLRRAAIVLAAALLCLFVGHVFAVYAARHRALHYDEAQYLHVGWLMAQGHELYRDFAEDHAPFLFVILKWLVPEGARPDLLSYTAHARAVTAVCGVLALASIGVLTLRMTRSLFAPVVTTATLLGSFWVWHSGLADVRNDPPALLLFWLGVLLLAGRWRSQRTCFALAGTGIGLTVAAALWNPKMPFECVVLGGVYLWRLRQAFRAGPRMVAVAIAPAVAIVGITVLLIASVVSLRDYVFFTFQYNRAYVAFHDAGALRDQSAFLYCDPAFRGWWPFLAIAVAMAMLVRRVRDRVGDLDLHAHAIVLALAIAAGLDIRFVFAYPDLWPQYYLMWDFAVAALYGTIASALLRSVGNARLEDAMQIAAAIVAVVLVQQSLPTSTGGSSWQLRSVLRQKLRPQETVWLTPDVHPIDVVDASYYWFGFNDLIPASLHYVATHAGQSPLPFASEQDLPICRAERGLEPHLRFVSGQNMLATLPASRQCLERLIGSGRAVRVPGRYIWDLQPHPPVSGDQ